MTSSRAKAFGKLASSRCLLHACKYYNVDKTNIKVKPVSYCDNKGLNKRMTQLRDESNRRAPLGLLNDADVCSLIYATNLETNNTTYE